MVSIFNQRNAFDKRLNDIDKITAREKHISKLTEQYCTCRISTFLLVRLLH